MLQVGDLLDRALHAGGHRSDRQLSLALGLASNAVWAFRQGKILPASDTIIKLCQVVGDDPRPALADLGALKSQGEARRLYEEMAAILREKAA